MKKIIIYGIVMGFSILMIMGGIITISEEGAEVIDIIMLLAFLLLLIFSIYKLIKIKGADNKKKLERNHQRTEFENKPNKINVDHDNKDKQIHSEEVKSKKVIEGKEAESDAKLRSIELLKMKLKLKEEYIQQLENEKQLQSIADEKKTKENSSFETPLLNEEENTIDNEELSILTSPLDLSYTKARKITPDFVVLDFETTGLKYNEHEIIQYGIVEFKNGLAVNEYSQYFKPDKPVEKTVMRKTGITNEFLEDKPKISASYLEELKDILTGKTIVAHNASFDMKFLLKNLHDFNVSHDKFRVFDTLSASRRLINETPNHKLETLKNHFNLDNGDSHEALNDARATGNLALLLLERSN